MAQGDPSTDSGRTGFCQFVVSADFIESPDRVGPVEPGAGEIIRRFLEHKVFLEQSRFKQRQGGRPTKGFGIFQVDLVVVALGFAEVPTR